MPSFKDLLKIINKGSFKTLAHLLANIGGMLSPPAPLLVVVQRIYLNTASDEILIDERVFELISLAVAEYKRKESHISNTDSKYPRKVLNIPMPLVTKSCLLRSY